MARNVATTVENNFVLGLITERTELRFPQNAATDIDNCVIDLYGRVSRRKGLDLEDNYSMVNYNTGSPNDSYVEYLWEGAGGNSDATFLVHQHGQKIRFYDISTSADVGVNVITGYVDLSTYIPSGSSNDPAAYPCQFAAGDGKLIVVSGAINPIYIEYTGGLFKATQIDIKIRDFEGIDDGLSLQTRPTESVSSLSTNNPQHYYNLLNQGWYSGDALSRWDTDRTDMPSNSDVVGLYRASATDAFDNAIVTARAPGSSTAPKGHFILSPFSMDRAAAALAEGFNVALGSSVKVDRTLGTNIGNMIWYGGLAKAFDGVSITTRGNSAGRNDNAAMVGKNYTTPGGSKIAGVDVALPTDWSFTLPNTVELRGSATNPNTNFFSGTLLGTITTTNRSFFINSSDANTTWNYFWTVLYRGNSGDSVWIAESTYYSSISTSSNIIFDRPSTTAFYNGRVFYAGTNAPDVSTKIYFTRIIENDAHFGQCYSDNDPSSETLNDFLPSDGGVISIPEAGLVTKLIVTNSSLLVLATNGVWLISGAGGAPFQATNYQVQKLSSIGSQSPRSYVDYKGTPIWWGDNGIYTVQFNPDYNSYTVVDTTQDSIRTFINNIPASNRQSVKGVYSIDEDVIYFLYRDTEDVSGLPVDTYNRVLVSVPRSKAFYPWSFNDSDFFIRGIAFVRDGDRSTSPRVKYSITEVNGSLGVAMDTNTYWAEISSDSYKDYTTYANVIKHDPTKEIDYKSYFIAGYYIHGETQRFFQGNYLFVFLDQDTQGSCKVRTMYDWSTSGNSGKWGAKQEVYPDWQILQSINYRRLKTRGKGNAMQLYFESEEGKPFSILGWSVFESGNANI